MASGIPEDWRQSVVRVLRGRGGHSEIVRHARRDWQNTFPDEFDFHLLHGLAQWLSQPVVEGEEVFGMVPPGKVYKFFFKHGSIKLFGKVGLHPNEHVIIFSAHVPRKGVNL